MEKTPLFINFSEISSIPVLIKDFLAGKHAAFGEFLFNKDNFQKKISEKEANFSTESREIISEVLSSQMAGDVSEQQTENLALLAKENTFTVVTGHQLNLFSGPSFFVYKILQTIKTAQLLKEWFPEKNFVPLFWMATEDHDFEEINHFRTENGFYSLKAESGQPVGRIIIKDTAFISEFEKEFKDTAYGTELIRWVKECYQPGKTLAEATRTLVNRLFANYGLLILDGDDARLKRQMIPAFAAELKGQLLHETTKNTVKFLEENYGKVQVNPREINLFYIKDQRERIDASGENFVLSESGKKINAEEIFAELEQNPENFSPNALLRPVYQETVLPNIAYIGGNAEIMYWLELADYFKVTKLPFPLLVPRNSMLFLKPKTLNKISKSGLEVADFFKNFAEVMKHEMLKDSELLPIINDNENALKKSFKTLKDEAETTDKTFKNLVEAEETRQMKSFERMRKRLLRAEKIKNSEKTEYLERLFLEVHPGKNWQERVYNFSTFYADEGGAWLQTCFRLMDVSQSGLIITEI